MFVDANFSLLNHHTCFGDIELNGPTSSSSEQERSNGSPYQNWVWLFPTKVPLSPFMARKNGHAIMTSSCVTLFIWWKSWISWVDILCVRESKMMFMVCVAFLEMSGRWPCWSRRVSRRWASTLLAERLVRESLSRLSWVVELQIRTTSWNVVTRF